MKKVLKDGRKFPNLMKNFFKNTEKFLKACKKKIPKFADRELFNFFKKKFLIFGHEKVPEIWYLKFFKEKLSNFQRKAFQFAIL
jgi:hypothetical protein